MIRSHEGYGDVVVHLSTEISFDLNWQQLDHCIGKCPRILFLKLDEELLSTVTSVQSPLNGRPYLRGKFVACSLGTS
jgi:hypothetical protein